MKEKKIYQIKKNLFKSKKLNQTRFKSNYFKEIKKEIK